jgi:GAF domain-containing protein
MSSRVRPKKARQSSKPSDLRAERETFVRSFLHKGVELTEDLIRENETLAERARKLEDENTRLRAQLKSNDAIRELLTKIESLENERRALLNRSTELAAVAEQIEASHEAVEHELNDLASLYVAAFQLSGTLSVPRVVQHMSELLEQLVGARSFAIYLVDLDGERARPIASRGFELRPVEPVSLEDGPLADVCLTGLSRVRQGPLGTQTQSAANELLAVIPLVFDEEVIGVIAVAELLPHKRSWARVDHELFKLLSVHGAAALIAANLYENEAGPRLALRGVHEHLEAKPEETSQVEE